MAGPTSEDLPIARYVHKGLRKKRQPHVAFPRGHGRPVALQGDFPYTFQMQIRRPSGHGNRTEAFEWRHTKGKAVKRTGHRTGYKLVRLSTDAGIAGGDIASGGGEVVAVLTTHGSWRRAGTFMFQGSGAQGILGEHWQLVAIMTAIRIWDKRRTHRALVLRHEKHARGDNIEGGA